MLQNPTPDSSANPGIPPVPHGHPGEEESPYTPKIYCAGIPALILTNIRHLETEVRSHLELMWRGETEIHQLEQLKLAKSALQVAVVALRATTAPRRRRS
jgi:hypothetical protein